MINSIDRIIELNPSRLTSCHVNQIYNDALYVLPNIKIVSSGVMNVFGVFAKQPASIHDMADNHLIYAQHPTSLWFSGKNLCL
jgi:hypothetical protein